MARPDSIARLHEAFYEFQIATGEERVRRKQIYEALLEELAREYTVAKEQLADGLRRDYNIWRKQEQLPPPSRKPQQP